MRRVIVIAALVAGSAAAALAQPGPGRGPGDTTMIESRVTELSERLLLSPEQERDIRTVMHEEAARARQARQEYGGDREAMRQEMRRRIEASDRRIEQLLTDEQREAYRRYREERRREMRERSGERPRP